MIEVQNFSSEELSIMKEAIEQELSQRKRNHFNELVEKFIEAARELKREYPWVSYYKEIQCEGCDFVGDYDLFDIFPPDELHIRNFSF